VIVEKSLKLFLISQFIVVLQALFWAVVFGIAVLGVVRRRNVNELKK